MNPEQCLENLAAFILEHVGLDVAQFREAGMLDEVSAFEGFKTGIALHRNVWTLFTEVVDKVDE